MTYTTQMHAARQGIITKEMELVAEKEGISPEELRQYMAEGKAVIPANKLHKCLNPNGVGSMLKTKINVKNFRNYPKFYDFYPTPFASLIRIAFSATLS